MPVLLVLGATSDMARATALEFRDNGWDLILAARDLDAAKAVASDLEIRGNRMTGVVRTVAFDAFATETHKSFWNDLGCCPEGVLCAIGGGGDPLLAQRDLPLAAQILITNFTGLVPVLLLAADAFEARGRGFIIGIGSVAGDRGRAANYLYGSAKAGFAVFLAGLRNRLTAKGVLVMTVKPGPAFTKMSEGLALNPLLTARPEEIGRAIFKAFENKRQVVYVKPIWRYIMLVIRMLPDAIFNKLNLEVKKQA